MPGDNIDHALRGYCDRVVSLHADRDALNGDIRSVYREAKDAGFDTTTLREIVREMRMDSDARNSRYQLLNEYRMAVGILLDTPLGQAAEERVVAMPAKTFAEQPVHEPRPRGRPRNGNKPMFDA